MAYLYYICAARCPATIIKCGITSSRLYFCIFSNCLLRFIGDGVTPIFITGYEINSGFIRLHFPTLIYDLETVTI